MKTAKKIWLIIAICFVVSGVIISAVSLDVLNFDFTRLDSKKYITEEHEITEAFNSIYIDVSTSDVELIRSDSARCTVVCVDEEKLKHNVAVVNNTLTISVEDSRSWYDHIGISFAKSMSITVYLPYEQYDSLKIRSNTGEISIPKFTFGETVIETDTGDIDFSANVSGAIDISTDTGTVAFGDIKAQDVTLESDTGNITFNSVDCKKIDVESGTGNVRLNNTVASEKISIKTNTGDVRFEYSDGDTIAVITGTGNVSGRLLSPKVFVCKSDTGRVDVPDYKIGGKCEITTDTGDIKIETGK